MPSRKETAANAQFTPGTTTIRARSGGMARFFFDFNDEREDRLDEMSGTSVKSLDAAIVAAAASLALSVVESGEGAGETRVVVGDDKGQQATVELSLRVTRAKPEA